MSKLMELILFFILVTLFYGVIEHEQDRLNRFVQPLQGGLLMEMSRK